MHLLNATDEEREESPPPPSGLLQNRRRCYYQTPAVGCFLLSPAKQSPCYLGENELPNISRLNRLIPKWAPEGANGVVTNICSRAACHAPLPPISAVTSFQRVSHYHACGIHGGVELLYYKAPFSSSIQHKLPLLWRPKLRTQQASAEKYKYIFKKKKKKEDRFEIKGCRGCGYFFKGAPLWGALRGFPSSLRFCSSTPGWRHPPPLFHPRWDLMRLKYPVRDSQSPLRRSTRLHLHYPPIIPH